jgi:hypothetical protein
VTVVDALSGPLGFLLTGVSSNEPGIGNDAQGWDVDTPDTAGVLRAERSGTGSGRTYSIRYAGTDKAGNRGTCVATVVVPHDAAP